MTRTGVPQPRPPAQDHLARLRLDFDQSFARAPEQDRTEHVDVLTLTLGQEVCALRLGEVAEIAARPLLTTVPATAPVLLGLTASRGRVIAAYDLSGLLGGPAASPRWLVVPVQEPGIGFTFEHFNGYRQIPPDVSATARLITMSSLVGAVHALNQGRHHRSGEAP